jgi:hypothetical protein
MEHEHLIRRYRQYYTKLLRFYPKPYRERFGQGMEQTFNDLLRERARQEKEIFGFAVWMCVETSLEIIAKNLTALMMKNKNMIRIVIAVAFLLLVPLVAMQFTNEVVWTLTDFVVAGILLLGAGFTYELIASKSGITVYRAAAAIAVGTALFLVWVNLAVGVIGSENERANLMYIGVLAVGIIGTFISRLQPQGMSRALFATAFAQVLVTLIALIARMDQYSGSSVTEILGVNGFFIMLWIASALLFRRASHSSSIYQRNTEIS